MMYKKITLNKNAKAACKQAAKRKRPVKLSKAIYRSAMSYPRGKYRNAFLTTVLGGFIPIEVLKKCHSSIKLKFD